MDAKTQTKIFDYGKRYDVGQLYGVPALVGHEFAVVETGIRGVRIKYFPPEESVALERELGVESQAPSVLVHHPVS